MPAALLALGIGFVFRPGRRWGVAEGAVELLSAERFAALHPTRAGRTDSG